MTEIKIAAPTDAFHSALHMDRDRWSQIHARSLRQVGLLFMSAEHVTGEWANEAASPATQSYSVCKEAQSCLSVGLVLPQPQGGAPRGPLSGWRAQYAPERNTSPEDVKTPKANDALLSALYSATAAHQLLRASSDADSLVAVLALKERKKMMPWDKSTLFVPTALQLIRKPDWSELQEATVMLPDTACRKLQPRSLLLRVPN